MLQKYIDRTENDDGKIEWISIYEVIYYVYFKEEDNFPKELPLNCKKHANITQNIPSKSKNKIKKPALESGLYSQVIIIKRHTEVSTNKKGKK